ncbi:MAG: hypothetical protein FJ279_11110 [Planctomycetes bacterium]|nr:hypothetical protein [Planctomycetota bacterium]
MITPLLCFRRRFLLSLTIVACLYAGNCSRAAAQDKGDSALGVVHHLNTDKNLTVLSALPAEELARTSVKSGKRDLSALDEAGLRVFVSGAGDTAIIMSHPKRPVDSPRARRPLILASHLLDALPEALLDKRERGYLPCTLLGEGCSGWLFDLFDVRGLWKSYGLPQDRDVAGLGDLHLGVWPTRLIVVRDDSVKPARMLRVLGHSSFFDDPPHRFWSDSGPQSGSPVWWLWPYTAAGWAQKPVRGLEPKTYSLGELLRRISSRAQVSVDIETREDEVSSLPVHLFTASPTLGGLLWAAEVMSGLQLKIVHQDALTGILTSARDPDNRRSPDSLVSLPGQGYVNPYRTGAGERLVKRDLLEEAGSPLHAVWRLSDLAPIYETRLVRPEFEAQGIQTPRSDQLTLIWIGCIEMDLSKRRKGSSAMTTQFQLPVF